MFASCNDELELADRDGTYEFLEDGFSGVSVQDGFELYMISGETSKVRIESDENIIDYVKFETKNKILYFFKDPGVQIPSQIPVKIYVTVPSVDVLIVLSSKAEIVDTLKTNDIRLVCSDRSSLTGRLECKRLQSVINNSTVELTGFADNVQTNINNGSTVHTFKLESANVEMDIAGGSFAEITVSNELSVVAKENSVVHYRGTAVIRSLTSDDSVVKELK
jgi:hypothetical protein